MTCICILPFGYILSDPGLNLAMHAASCNSTNSSVNQDTRFNSVNYQVEGQDYHIRNWDYQETLCIALYLMMVMVLCGLALHCMVFDFLTCTFMLCQGLHCGTHVHWSSLPDTNLEWGNSAQCDLVFVPVEEQCLCAYSDRKGHCRSRQGEVLDHGSVIIHRPAAAGRHGVC